MKSIVLKLFPLLFLVLFIASCNNQDRDKIKQVDQEFSGDPLPSWNEVDSKHIIINFVNSVTDKSSPDFAGLKIALSHSTTMVPFGVNGASFNARNTTKPIVTRNPGANVKIVFFICNLRGMYRLFDQNLIKSI